MRPMYASSVESVVDPQTPDGSWWVAVARALDDLDDRLADEAAEDEGPSGAFHEAVSREPSLSTTTRRLSADRLRIAERARRLRRLVAQVAGDARHASAVSSELTTLARAEGRYRERSRTVLWDSFARDIGGE